jgi:amino acid transporter
VTCAALPVLRKRSDAPAAQFRLPGGPVIAVAALILSAWLLYNSTLYEAIATTIAAAVGFAIYFAYRVVRYNIVKDEPT